MEEQGSVVIIRIEALKEADAKDLVEVSVFCLARVAAACAGADRQPDYKVRASVEGAHSLVLSPAGVRERQLLRPCAQQCS